jgi:hypothetical protein
MGTNSNARLRFGLGAWSVALVAVVAVVRRAAARGRLRGGHLQT